LPLSVICELLGLPSADRPKFIGWAGNITGVRSTIGFLWRMIRGVASIKRYLEAHLENARASGGEGLIAELVRVEKEGARLSRAEMVAMVFLLLFAGHETTTHLVSGSVFELLRNRGLRDWLAEDWSALISRSRNSCASSLQCNSPNHASYERTLHFAACS
jgi:cytochrome P450